MHMQVLELCNFLFVMSGLAQRPVALKRHGVARHVYGGKAGRDRQADRNRRADPGWSAADLNQTLAAFRRCARVRKEYVVSRVARAYTYAARAQLTHTVGTRR